MIERNIKKLLLEALSVTGDDPEEVECNYVGHPLYIPGAPPPMVEEGSASSLPEGDLSVLGCISEKFIYKLVKTDKEIKIETTSRTKQG